MNKLLKRTAATTLLSIAPMTHALADQVILDDLIVDGSICAGTDCVNGESFGFDTIRIKENNLRIKAEDTSTSASFPSNDWQITFNDSSNGGANKFSIDDITGGRTPFTIEAGAPSNSLYVDDSGRLGLGTSTPVVDIHVVSGNTPTNRLEQDGSSGFTPQTWDVAGNEANFFIRDVTNGSTLPFRLRVGAPTSAIDIAASGDVGLGTSSPSSELHILRSNKGPKLTMESTGTPDRKWELVVRPDGEFALNDADTVGADFIFKTQNSGGARPWQLVRRADGEFALNDPNTTGADFIFAAGSAGGLTVQGDVTCNGTAPCFNNLSDLRHKTNVRNLTGAGKIVRELRPILWDSENGTVSSGLGAQEVAAVFERNGIPSWSGHTYKANQDRHYLSYTSLIGILVGAYQEKDTQIEELQTMISKLQARLDSLESRVE